MSDTEIRSAVSALSDPWLRDFPSPLPEEVDRYAEGTSIPQFAALALYQKRTKIAMGPAKMLFDALTSDRRKEGEP